MSKHNDKPDPKPSLLVIGPTPPPYSGPEICTAALLGAVALNSAFEIDHVETSLRATNADRGRLDLAAVRGYIRFVREVRRALDRKPDVVYQILGTNATGLVRDLTSIRMAAKRGIPVVAQVRGGHFAAYFRGLRGPAHSLVATGLGRLSRLLVEGEAIRASFEGIVPLDRIEVVRHAVPGFGPDLGPEFAPESPDTSHGSDSGATQILFVGHRSVAKGWLELLRALEELRTTDWHLTAMGTRLTKERNVFVAPIGEPAPQSEIDDLEARLADRLTLLGGSVVGDAKAHAFSGADVFVLPSYSEGLSVAVCEAMRAGLPVITTTVGALPEVVQDGVGGCLVQPGDTAALGSALERLLGDAELRTHMGQTNRAVAADLFDTELVAESYVRAFAGTVKLPSFDE
jgi:glycosyltransferase involved in cell wall biosynthesis